MRTADQWLDDYGDSPLWLLADVYRRLGIRF
jgi:hypothetical protein